MCPLLLLLGNTLALHWEDWSLDRRRLFSAACSFRVVLALLVAGREGDVSLEEGRS